MRTDRDIAAVDARREFERRMTRSGRQGDAISIRCPKCRKSIPSTMPWRCSRCSFDNLRTDIYSFLYKCQKCEDEPTAVACPRCGLIVILTKDRQTTFPARAIPPPPPPPPPLEPERHTHEKEKQRLEREIEIAQLKAKLAQARRAAEPVQEKGLEEALIEELEGDLKQGMAVENAVAKVNRRISEEFKDDPDGLEKRQLWIERWRERHIRN